MAPPDDKRIKFCRYCDGVIEWGTETCPHCGEALKMTEVDARRVLDDVTAAPVRPYYSRLVLDRVGNLWVEQAPVIWTDPGPVDYLVFDPEGVLLGAVTLPPIDVLEIGDDYVLGIYRDEMEVEYLHVHAIMKPLL